MKHKRKTLISNVASPICQDGEKNLSDLCLFFLIFSLFSWFFPSFSQFFTIFFAVFRGWHSDPHVAPSGYTTDINHSSLAQVWYMYAHIWFMDSEPWLAPSLEASGTKTYIADAFYTIFGLGISTCFPEKRKRVHSNDKSWITPHVKNLIVKRQTAFT